MQGVDDAIILAGGLGSRMLPASLYAPKEVLPLVDTPIINHLILEAVRAGVSRIHLVLSDSKMKYLKQFLENKTVYDEKIRPDLPRSSLSLGVDGVQIFPHVQHNAGGVADAISVAIDEITGPFLVLLGDMVIMDNHECPQNMRPSNASSASLRLVKKYEKTGQACVGLFPVEIENIQKYGTVKFEGGKITGIVEKPDFESAPSNYVLCGRYLLTDDTKKIIEKYPVSEYGEMQSIYMLGDFIGEDRLNSVKFDDMEMYDSGDPLSWLKSQVDHALRRDDIGRQLEKWIKSRIE